MMEVRSSFERNIVVFLHGMHEMIVQLFQTGGLKFHVFLIARLQKQGENKCVIITTRAPITDPSRDTSDRGSGHRTSSRRA